MTRKMKSKRIVDLNTKPLTPEERASVNEYFMKQHFEIKPNYAPVYAAAMYPGLCEIFQKHGYALAVHGSLARDLDLVALPWGKKVSSWKKVIKAMTSVYALNQCGDPEAKPYKRTAYTFSCGFGDCQIDLSFFR